MKYEMNIHVQIRQFEKMGYEGLNVSETLPFEADSFAELCSVLTKFHELAENIKRLQALAGYKAVK